LSLSSAAKKKSPLSRLLKISVLINKWSNYKRTQLRKRKMLKMVRRNPRKRLKSLVKMMRLKTRRKMRKKKPKS
jgi:hypothetical protein